MSPTGQLRPRGVPRTSELNGPTRVGLPRAVSGRVRPHLDEPSGIPPDPLTRWSRLDTGRAVTGRSPSLGCPAGRRGARHTFSVRLAPPPWRRHGPGRRRPAASSTGRSRTRSSGSAGAHPARRSRGSGSSAPGSPRRCWRLGPRRGRGAGAAAPPCSRRHCRATTCTRTRAAARSASTARPRTLRALTAPGVRAFSCNRLPAPSVLVARPSCRDVTVRGT